MNRAAKIAVALAAFLAAGVPVSTQALESRPVRSLLEARHQNVVVQEWDSSCGAAALATVLRFQLGDPVTERSVALGILRRTDPDRVRGRGGFSLLDLKRFAEARGFAADGYAGLTDGQLLRLAPAIVPIRSYTGDHFIVFRGVVDGQAVIADPAFGNRSLPFSQFARLWKDRLGFVVKPRTRAAANRMFPTRRDLLRVEDDAARAAMDDTQPKPLTDAQLAQAFAIAPVTQAPHDLVATASGVAKQARSAEAAGRSVSSASQSAAGPTSTSTVASASTPPSTLSTAAPLPSTSTISTTVSTISSTTPTLPGTGTLVTAPSIALPSVTLPISTPSLPTPVSPLGR